MICFIAGYFLFAIAGYKGLIYTPYILYGFLKLETGH